MKKLNKLLLVILSIFALTGCAKKVSFEEFVEASKHLEQAPNISKMIVRGRIDDSRVKYEISFVDGQPVFDEERLADEKRNDLAYYAFKEAYTTLTLDEATKIKLDKTKYYTGSKFLINNDEITLRWTNYGALTLIEYECKFYDPFFDATKKENKGKNANQITMDIQVNITYK